MAEDVDGGPVTDESPAATPDDEAPPEADDTAESGAKAAEASSAGGDEATGTNASDEAGGKAESEGATLEGGLDVEAERGRLDEVGEQIDQARRALADVEGDTDPEPEGPPIAAGEGAANAPPG